MKLILSGPAGPLHGKPRVPGDKSISHRALLLASMAHGPSRLRRFLRAGVTDAMLSSLAELGVEAEFVGEEDLVVLGRSWKQPSLPLDCGNSGTTMRMLLGPLASRPLTVTLDGTPRLRQRPMGRVVNPLRSMGALITSPEEGFAPLTVHGGPLHGIEYTLPVASAQVKTALLLAALGAEGPTTLTEPGPSRDHTERMLMSMGVSLQISGSTIQIIPESSPLPALNTTIPGDISAAAFLITAATLVPGSRISLSSIGINPTRTGLLDVLLRMGARIETGPATLTHGEPSADLEISASSLHGTEISGNEVVRMIDEFPALAVAATQAEGTTVIRDAGELRVKESDRISALAAELRKMGADIEERPDGFLIHGPTPLSGAHVQSHSDHRLAMALAAAALSARGETVIEGAESINQSFPAFPALLAGMGAEIR